MKLAFVLFKYFPYGGLQRDMLRIAQACQQRGYAIDVYTMSWQGEIPAGFRVTQLPARGTRNFVRYRHFIREMHQQLAANPVDAVIGFNRMQGLDVYYAADPCFRQAHVEGRSALLRLLGRYRFFLQQEEAVFGTASNTRVLMISALQLQYYRQYYGTADSRIRMLPPGILRDRMATDDRDVIRAGFRKEFALAPDQLLLLSLGSGFSVKGFDRGLIAVAALPHALRQRVRVFIIGQDKRGPTERLVKRLGLQDNVRFFSGRDDIPRFLQGADLLLHPARHENTGTVLLEAMVAGLPVLTTATCGYAYHVSDAAAGRVLPAPFRQDALNATLEEMLCSDERASWSANGIAYGRSQDLYSLHERAAGYIHEYVQAKQDLSR
jgi:UDP-glucose:(heptosyl)LPS alpha-1,3-glucosyltransferase